MRRLLRVLAWTLAGAFLLFLGLSIGLVLLFGRFAPPTTAFMIQARLAAALDPQPPPYRTRQQWLPYASISPLAGVAVVASEDQKFPYHDGFDFKSIQDAMRTADAGGRVRGASTISQQVAKNLFLWSGRSFVRKGLEAWFTVLIEGFWTKQRILEMYLNVAEFGRGIYGVEAASQQFFGKSAARLTAPEAALLAAVLPNPRLLRADRPSAYVRRRQGEITAQMAALGGARYLQSLN